MKELLPALFLIATTIFGLFGCGEDKADDGRVEISFATSSWKGEMEFAEKIKEKFEAANPGIKLKIVPITSSYFQKILTMTVGGTAPDVFWMPHGDEAMEFMKRKAVLELGPMMEKDAEFQEIRKDIDDRAYRNAIFGGKIYGQPIWLGIMGMFYNKDLFDEHEIPYPNGSWTWDEFLVICRKMTSEEDNIYGTYVERGIVWSMIWSQGAKLYDSENLECFYNSPDIMNAYQLAKDYIYKYKIAPEPVSLIRPDEGNSDIWERFKAGRLAITYEGAYMMRDYNKIENFEWGFTLPPRGKAGNSTYLMGINFGISNQTKHPEEAWKFIKFCLSEEVQRLTYSMKGDIPLRTSIQQSEHYLDSDPGREINEAIIEAVKHGRREAKFDTLMFGSEWVAYVDQQIALLFLDEDSVKAICNRITKEFYKRKQQIKK